MILNADLPWPQILMSKRDKRFPSFFIVLCLLLLFLCGSDAVADPKAWVKKLLTSWQVEVSVFDTSHDVSFPPLNPCQRPSP